MLENIREKSEIRKGLPPPLRTKVDIFEVENILQSNGQVVNLIIL